MCVTPDSERDRAQLREQSTRNLDWITSHIKYFTPSRDKQLTDSGIKAFAEFAIVYMYLEQWSKRRLSTYLPLRKMLPCWRDFITAQLDNPAYAETVRKRPPQAYYLLLPYLVLRANGYVLPYYEETLERLNRQGYLTPPEVVPHRRMDQQYILWKSGYLVREPNWNRLYKSTVLGRNLSLPYIDQEMTYSITHTVFYLTDFGNRSASLKTVEIKRITSVVECLLFHYWRMFNWDVVAELLINLNCLGARDSVFYSGASRAFRNASRSDGAIPANSLSKERIRSTPRPERDATVFQVCYHTTLLSVLHCATALSKLTKNGLQFNPRNKKSFAPSADLA